MYSCMFIFTIKNSLVTERLPAQVLLLQNIHLKSCGICVTQRSLALCEAGRGACVCFTSACLNNKTQITKLKPIQHCLYKGGLNTINCSLHSPTVFLDALENKFTSMAARLCTQISLGSTCAAYLAGSTQGIKWDKQLVGQGFF